MIELKEGLKLFHGSYLEVSEPDISKCGDYKDFGKGFYLTTSQAQTMSFAKLSTRKAKDSGRISKSQDFGVVSCFVLKDISFLNKVYFDQIDIKWLHCIVAHRKKGSFNSIVDQLKDIDIIGGKIANDATNATLNAYMAGTFGQIGSDEADRICIELLLPNRLENQFCFRSSLSLDCLEFEGSEKIWMKE